MTDEIIINIDCYQCGTKLEIPFKLHKLHSNYVYCQSCQEGVQIYFDGNTLHIDRLEQK